MSADKESLFSVATQKTGPSTPPFRVASLCDASHEPFILCSVQLFPSERKLIETNQCRTDLLFRKGSSLQFALPVFAGAQIFIVRMRACLDVDILVESAGPQLKDLVEVGASYGDSNTDEECEAFAHQALMMEGTLSQTFRAATLIAKKSSELEEVANVWRRMQIFCETILTTLAELKEKHPWCGTPRVYDLALKYKQACADRLRDVEEEIECQKIDLPKGLLPELS